MPKTRKRPKRTLRSDTFRYVFLDLWAKKLDPDKITKRLGIQPNSAWRRGIVRNQDGVIIRDKNGKARRMSFGAWILDPCVRRDARLETQIMNIAEQIAPKRAALRRILEDVNGTLIIVVEPNEDLYVATYHLPASLLDEFTSLGIGIEFRFDNPRKWNEFREEVRRRYTRENWKKARKRI